MKLFNKNCSINPINGEIKYNSNESVLITVQEIYHIRYQIKPTYIIVNYLYVSDK